VSTVKQVARDDPGGLLAEKRPPARGRAARGRIQPVTAEGRADRGCRDVHAEAQQFSLDALVAPAGVLPGQADDQLLDVLVERGSPCSTLWVGPRAGDQTPVPAQQRLRLDEETRPARLGQDTADGGEQRPVGGLQLGSWSLAAQHGELMAQDEELKILGGVAVGEEGEQLDGAAQCQVGESWQHAGWPPRWAAEAPR
jgi:hypothetical protein